MESDHATIFAECEIFIPYFYCILPMYAMWYSVP
jgi:hypothetical protein